MFPIKIFRLNFHCRLLCAIMHRVWGLRLKLPSFKAIIRKNSFLWRDLGRNLSIWSHDCVFIRNMGFRFWRNNRISMLLENLSKDWRRRNFFMIAKFMIFFKFQNLIRIALNWRKAIIWARPPSSCIIVEFSTGPTFAFKLWARSRNLNPVLCTTRLSTMMSRISTLSIRLKNGIRISANWMNHWSKYFKYIFKQEKSLPPLPPKNIFHYNPQKRRDLL